jgi:hypothetical protein
MAGPLPPRLKSKRGKPQKPNETAKIQPNRIKSNLAQSKSIQINLTPFPWTFPRKKISSFFILTSSFPPSAPNRRKKQETSKLRQYQGRACWNSR